MLFGEALHHVIRLARVLTSPRGHAVLVGLTGVGRTSCLSIAAVLAGVKIATVEFSNSSAVISPSAVVSKAGSAGPANSAAAKSPPRKRRGDAAGAKFTHTGYGTVILTGAHVEFRDRLKQVLYEVGVHNRPVALHVFHAQVVSPELDAMGTLGAGGATPGFTGSITTDHDMIMDDIHQVRRGPLTDRLLSLTTHLSTRLQSFAYSCWSAAKFLVSTSGAAPQAWRTKSRAS